MASQLRRPILVGGIGLSVALWAWDSLHHSVGELGEWSIVGLAAVGAAALLLRKNVPPLDLTPPTTAIDRAAVERAIGRTQAYLTELESEIAHQALSETPSFLSSLQHQLEQLTPALDRTMLHLALVGGKSVGKTTLKQVLALETGTIAETPIEWVECPTLFTYARSESESVSLSVSSQSAHHADLVLFLVTGDITEPESQALQDLTAAGQKVLLVWNKQDQCLPTDRSDVLQKIRERVQGFLPAENVMAIAASPSPIKVLHQQANDTVTERLEAQSAQITPLMERLTQTIARDKTALICGSVQRQAMSLQHAIHAQLNHLRRDRALPIVAQYQWISAAAAFANPLPALDLLATGAVNGQLIVDLGAIYKQQFSIEQAKAIAATLCEFMLKLGLVELSTQTVTSFLKTNAMTYVAGGAVQGVSAAYLTRIAGLSLIEFFQQQPLAIDREKPTLSFETFGATLQQVFQQNQRTAFVKSFVTQTWSKLSAIGTASV